MDNFTKINVQKAREIIDSCQANVVDIRDGVSFAQGHIEGAQQLDHENIVQFINTTDKTKPLICYCYHGISSQQAAAYLASQGFRKVYSLDGGWEEWKKIYG